MTDSTAEVAMPPELDEFIKANHKKKFQFGIIAALLCAVYWGVWYVPGYAIWSVPGFLLMDGGAYEQMVAAGQGEDVSYTMACILLCLINAIIDTLILFIWNGALGKLGELKRTFVEFKAANIYFVYAGICGAGAVFGTYIAAQFLNPGFAAVAGVLYALVGTIMSVVYLHQKVTKRGFIAVGIMIVGAFVLFSGTIFGGGESANMTIGLIGGVMCAVCWGLEGTFAGKALDYCEPDCGIQLRFFWEMVLWIIVCGVIAACGIPIFSTIALVVTDPAILLMVILLGFSFAWCYVTWYKSFPFIGVARGQAIGSLYAACGIIFMVLFFGVDLALNQGEPVTTLQIVGVIGGLIICLFGSYLIATEDAEGLVSLKDESVMGGGE